MESASFMKVDEVAQELGVSKSYAYKIVQKLNAELAKKGYMVISGRVAFVMERHGIEWEHKGSHEKHLSVLDYKKQERATELEQLGAKIEEKQTEFNVLRKDNGKLANENKKLVTQNRDYNLLRKVFGSKQIDELLAKAKEPKQSKQRDERFRKNKDYER